MRIMRIRKITLDWQDYMKEVATAVGEGDLQLSMFAVVPKIHATYFYASKHPEGHAFETLLDEETAGAWV